MSDEQAAIGAPHPARVLREVRPGTLFVWVKRASYVELALFAGLIVVWLLPGLEGETFVSGSATGSATSPWCC